ncbi:hypothetical protein ABH19_11060 [Leptospirillum sp. Group II 'CF-1']|nr:hypothetical protein ABH19_11060 [Leptospirillum sp. Group II 'CF-1']
MKNEQAPSFSGKVVSERRPRIQKIAPVAEKASLHFLFEPDLLIPSLEGKHETNLTEGGWQGGQNPACEKILLFPFRRNRHSVSGMRGAGS